MKFQLNYSFIILLIFFASILRGKELPDSISTKKIQIFLQVPSPAFGFEKVIISNNTIELQAFITFDANLTTKTTRFIFDTLKSPSSFIDVSNPLKYNVSPSVGYGFRFFFNPNKALTNKFHPFLSLSKESYVIPNDIIIGGGLLYSITNRLSFFYVAKIAINLIDRNFILQGATYGIRTYNFSRLAVRYYF